MLVDPVAAGENAGVDQVLLATVPTAGSMTHAADVLKGQMSPTTR
jgi:hypothetical protein